MKRKPLKKIVLCCLLLVAVAVGWGAFYAGGLLQSDRLSRLLENQLQRRLGKPVSIGKAALQIHRGLLVDLDDIRIGDSGEALFDAQQVQVTLSLLDLIRGNLEIQELLLTRPDISLQLDSLLTGKQSSTAALPRIIFRDGRLTLTVDGHPFRLESLNGHLQHNFINLETALWGGKAKILAKQEGSGWKAGLKLKNFSFAAISPTMQGMADLAINLTARQESVALTAEADARSVVFPGGGEPIETCSLSMAADGNRNNLQIQTLSLTTPPITIAGKGSIELPADQGPEKSPKITFALRSSESDYETLVAHLPAELLPDWLFELLYKQIRGGSLQFENIDYQGSLADFNADGDFFNRLSLAGRIKNVSYGAGHGPERITQINADMAVSEGALIFRNISGQAGDATLQSVDLIFPQLMDPDLRTVVHAEIEMPIAGFAHAWRAAVYPREVHRLLDPLTDIRDGRISASVTLLDNVTVGQQEVKGFVQLDNCSFTWDGDLFDNVDGQGKADRLNDPLQINASGLVNRIPFDSLDVTLTDPFETPHTRFTVRLGQLEKLGGVRFDRNTAIQLIGKSTGVEFAGSVQLASKGVEIGDIRYRAPQGLITAKGKIAGRLAPEFEIEFKEVAIQTASSRLKMRSKLNEHGGNISLNGSLLLYPTDESGSKTDCPLKGGIDMALGWGDKLPLSGFVNLDHLSSCHRGQPASATGKLSIRGKTISSRSIRATYGESNIQLAGALTTGARMHFKGNVAVDGLRVERQESGITLPEDISVQADIRFSDLRLYGLFFDKGQAAASLEKGQLRFTKLDLQGQSAMIKGEYTLRPDNGEAYHLELDLRNKGFETMSRLFLPDRELITGYTWLRGNIAKEAGKVNGRLTFSAREGHAMKSTLLSKLFGALNVYKIIKSRQLELTDDRFAFNQITSTFQIKDNRVSFDDFYLDSDSIQFSAVGTVDLETKQIDSLVGVQPLETIDRAVSFIPLVGWVLTGEGDKLLVVSFRITGPADKPEIKIAPKDTIADPAKQALLRILELPEALIEKPKRIITGSDKN